MNLPNISAFDFSPDGSIVACGFLQGGVFKGGVQFLRLDRFNRVIATTSGFNAEVSPDGKTLGILSAEGRNIWQQVGLNPKRTVSLGLKDREIHIKFTTPEAHPLSNHLLFSGASSIRFSRNSELVAVARGDNIVVWDTAKFEERHEVSIPGEAFSDFCFSADGNALMVAKHDTSNVTFSIFEPGKQSVRSKDI